MVGRGTTQPSSQTDGAEMDAEDNLCSVENVGDQVEGGAPTTGGAGEDSAADAKRGTVQRLGRMGRAMEAGEEDATFHQESRQQVAKYAPCPCVSGAQRVSQETQGNEKPVHADIEAMDAWGKRSCMVDLV